MSRTRNRKSKSSKSGEAVIPGQEEEGSKETKLSNSGSSSSAMRGPIVPAVQLVQQIPAMHTTPFGQGYLERRSRPLPADEIQVVAQLWKWDVRGYHELDSPTLQEPAEYDGVKKQLNASYAYMRQVIKLSKKPRLLQDTVTDERMADYFNVYHCAGANLIWLLNFNMMYQYNEAFQKYSTYLPDAIVRVVRLYRRLNAIIVPDFVKAMTVRDGMIAHSVQHKAPHVRVWTNKNLTLRGTAAYDDTYLVGNTTIALQTILGSAATLLSFLDDIESSIQALEGIVGNAAPAPNDVLALKEIMEYIATVENFKPAYKQSLPSETSFPGVLDSPDIMNDWYCRLFTMIDNKGVGVDQGIYFPIMHIGDLQNRIPIKGYGVPGIIEYTLFGAVKFVASLNDAVNGVCYANTGSKRRFMGAAMPINDSNMYPENAKVQIYTREDGVLSWDTSYDLGDGGDIRTWFNGAWPLIKHIYHNLMIFAAQLTTALEYRNLDASPVDYEWWAEADDFGPNTAIWVAEQMGLPYLL
jgi:hypothetical protein